MRVRPLVSSLLALLCTMLAGSAAAVDVSVEPAFLFIPSGQAASVRVDAVGIGSEGLAAFQVEVLFDPTLLAASDPNAGSAEPFEPMPWLLTSTGRAPVGITSIDNVTGSVMIAYGTEPGPAHPVGSGALVEIEFTALAAGLSPLILATVILADGSVPPQSLPLVLFDGVLSSDPAVSDLDGDLIPENVDGLGLPGDQPCVGGTNVACDDNCPLVANTSQADTDANGLGDACQDSWTFSGVATGGSVSFDVDGVGLVVLTQSGETAAQVAAGVAAAINADPTLAALGIRAVASADSVAANAPIGSRIVDDIGLGARPLPFLPIVGWVEILLLAGSGIAAGRRVARTRASPGSVEGR